MTRRNIYKHTIDLRKLNIKNAEREEFIKKLEEIPYRGYEVEDISDGRKIVIVKPGGKQSFGRIRKEDFFVFIYDPKEQTLWQITHKQVYDDILEKSRENPKETIKILEAFERVYNGVDPDDILKDTSFENPIGENPEALLKAYKWIWGQEDVNYPTGKGRAMSWEGWEKDGDNWIKTGTGLEDLLEKLKKDEK
ncbi:hypothetical protein Tlie_0305 [Thermovirga lienii DSM 17291]|jgi:hypothetical protein|uniref:Uncharacterized protein n=1 Tax=Thermovirga lienii (strain ATCC BAA-1197 / DSM 17291 / Cas60314) TaxID=580340 RepID=G7V6T5_THELD|nr:hypothetical protein [Thermovirga lienii]AER66044.1 hypothetical protein Tlie_0305 [Thermovirga lienii DSM 17291]